MALEQRLQNIHEILKNHAGVSFLRKLTAELNYDFVGEKLPTREWAKSAREPLAGDPQLFATAAEGAFHIIYTQLKGENLLRSAERQIVNALLNDHPYALFVFSNSQQKRWHFVNVKYDAKNAKRRLFRRIAVGQDERLRTASERIAMLDPETINKNLFGITPLEIQECHDEAFNVELVTKQFFNEYKSIYDILQDDLTRQTEDRRWAHDYALQFLNRCMFLYFIQRKRWIGDDPEFLSTFWRSYRKNDQPKDTFFQAWLQVLFFEAFNNQKSLFNSPQRAYIPANLRKDLWRAPYLNGGLFSENDLDRAHRFLISDSRFQQVFDFLERYNFTIAEDSPLDQEVAVDPEMIGKVYESLVNVSTEADERGDAGIFYTPRTEIDLMCRLALVDHLANTIGEQHRNLLYELVFALEPHEKEMSDTAAHEKGLWNEIEKCLREVTTVDPACGSGSFLVGMLHVLDDLQCRAAGATGNRETAYERKRRIIGQSLYGVDVMPWAAHVAELRMWLALIIDAEFTAEELSERNDPLLPHFSFKIRSGDSLVQEVGGLSLSNLRGLRTGLSPALKTRVSNLKKEKLRFYNNETGRKFKGVRDLEQEELNLFRDLLDDRRNNLETEIRKIESQLDRPIAEQIDLLSGQVKKNARQLSWQDSERTKQLEMAREDLERVRMARQTLKSVRDVPFVWDIAFVEIFSDERCGFSIAVGNPPYVRQEAIADPRTPRDKVTTENKRTYKSKLQRAVYQAFPHFFGYDEKKNKARHALDAKSDLYIYFYFLTLPLLNKRGAFCFITSNSWLDVGYGADLQEFLLRRCHVRMVIDNASHRSFESADVNTVITLLSSPISDKADDDEARMLEQTARFVMFKTPFENVLSPVVFEEIEEASERRQTQEYRVFPVKQKELLKDGMELIEDENTLAKPQRKSIDAALVKTGCYLGNKWGGKYLRAPEVYWSILEKGQGKLQRLGSFAKVQRGFSTGVNDFFYFSDAKQAGKGLMHVVSEGGWEGFIEKEFIRRVIRSPRDCYTITIPQGVGAWVFWCHESRAKLKETHALKYIQNGEEQKYNFVSSVANRQNWYGLPKQQNASLFFPRAFFERFMTYMVPNNIFASDRFFTISTVDKQEATALFMNTLLPYLIVELQGLQVNHGGIDTKVFLVEDLPIYKDIKIDDHIRRLFVQVSNRPIELISKEIERQDRQEFDSAVLSQIGLTKKDVQAIHKFVAESAHGRILKAKRKPTKKIDEFSSRLEAVKRTQGIWQDVPEFEEIEA